MITCKVANMELMFEGKDDLVAYINKLADGESVRSTKEPKFREQRYHDGKANAFREIADLLANSDIP